MTDVYDIAGKVAAYATRQGGSYSTLPHQAGCGCGCETQGGLERVRFYPRQLIGADDLTQEQAYFRNKLRRHNRFLHGWGVVCGCEVRAVPTTKAPWQVVICPGYLLTPQGDEVYISSEAWFDLATCLVQSSDPCAFSRPCPPVSLQVEQTRKVYLAVRYIECEGRPQRVAPVGCGCDEADCENSRIYDAYEICCLDSLPASHDLRLPSCRELCRGGIFPCPTCTDDGWVVIAQVTLPAKVATQVTQGDIDNRQRKLLYSTTLIQRLAECECLRGMDVAKLEPLPPPPPPKPAAPPPIAAPGEIARAQVKRTTPRRRKAPG